MPQLDLGRLRFSYEGEYSGATTYERNDVVTYENDVYVYTSGTSSSGNAPTDTSRWAKMIEGITPGFLADAGKVLTTDGSSISWTDTLTLNTVTIETKFTSEALTYIGAGAEAWEGSASLTDAAAVIDIAGGPSSFAQVAFRNSTPTSSSDLIVYSNNGTDSEGWVDLGITGSQFDDSTYGITAQGDGYLFYQSKSAGTTRTITNKALDSNVATLTTSVAHGFQVGERVVISGVDSTFNGVYRITGVPNTDTFTYAKTYVGTISSISASGSAKVQPAGNLVFATGNNGTDNSIVFAAGGYASGNTQMTIIPDTRVHVEIATASTSPTTGALTVAGGVGITGDTYTDGNVILDGVLYIGPGAEAFETSGNLTSPAMVASIDGGVSSFAQIAFQNQEPTSSTDIIVYMDNGTDAAGWIDMGIAGSDFDDTTYGITAPGDGYIFHNAIDTTYLGNLVFATGDSGSQNKIIFAAGGYASGNTQMVITPDVNVHIEIPTPSTSPTTGALTVVGGVGISGDMNVNGNVAIQGTITFGGSGTTVETSNLAVTDPAVFVGTNNQADIVDLAFIGEYATTIATITKTVTNKALTSNVATLTTSADHTYLVGDVVVVTGVDATFNGTFNITAVPTTTTFTYSKTAGNVSSTAVSPTGTAAVSARRKFAGIARDATDGVIKVFKDATTKPTSTVNFSEAGLTYATVKMGGAEIGSVTNTEIGYLSGVTSSIQTQLSSKAAATNPVFTASSGIALKITNTGTGNSFLVEDDTSTDSTPFVIDAAGNVGIGIASPGYKLDVRGGRALFINPENYAIGITNTSGANGVWMGSGNADILQWSDWGGSERMRLNAASATARLQLAAGTVLEAPLTTRTVSGTTDTLVLADAGKLVELSNTSAITVTVPLNSSVAYPIGTQINLLQTNTGQVTVAATGGVTINANPGLKLRAQWAFATLIKRATDTWVLVGDITA